ncbi:proline-rich receptor-like protein kinase PERK12 [Rosa rugosa]|uniref:proline-rich receptor-like protein kinase PERK12 n=1 Tax=Rosa rugosa TaxID=74645 RepID=UPI002B415E21|nr:proline-rich receptor-like protein kinase PERK12 [Rosa rugosa]
MTNIFSISTSLPYYLIPCVPQSPALDLPPRTGDVGCNLLPVPGTLVLAHRSQGRWHPPSSSPPITTSQSATSPPMGPSSSTSLDKGKQKIFADVVPSSSSPPHQPLIDVADMQLALSLYLADLVESTTMLPDQAHLMQVDPVCEPALLQVLLAQQEAVLDPTLLGPNPDMSMFDNPPDPSSQSVPFQAPTPSPTLPPFPSYQAPTPSVSNSASPSSVLPSIPAFPFSGVVDLVPGFDAPLFLLWKQKVMAVVEDPPSPLVSVPPPTRLHRSRASPGAGRGRGRRGRPRGRGLHPQVTHPSSPLVLEVGQSSNVEVTQDEYVVHLPPPFEDPPVSLPASDTPSLDVPPSFDDLAPAGGIGSWPGAATSAE